jgi:hypothetical protein
MLFQAKQFGSGDPIYKKQTGTALKTVPFLESFEAI